MAEMVKAGFVKHVGLSGAGAATVRRADAVASHQRPADRIFARSREGSETRSCRRVGSWASASPHTASSVGVSSADTGRRSARRSPNDFRSRGPRSPLGTSNTTSVSWRNSARVADSKGATVAQVAIAWVLSRGSTSCRSSALDDGSGLTEALGAMTLTLTASDLEHSRTRRPRRMLLPSIAIRPRKWRCSTVDAEGTRHCRPS